MKTIIPQCQKLAFTGGIILGLSWKPYVDSFFFKFSRERNILERKTCSSFKNLREWFKLGKFGVQNTYIRFLGKGKMT